MCLTVRGDVSTSGREKIADLPRVSWWGLCQSLESKLQQPSCKEKSYFLTPFLYPRNSEDIPCNSRPNIVLQLFVFLLQMKSYSEWPVVSLQQMLYNCFLNVCVSLSVVSDSLPPHRLQPPGSSVHGILQASAVGSHSLLQVIFPGSNPHCFGGRILYTVPWTTQCESSEAPQPPPSLPSADQSFRCTGSWFTDECCG